MLQGHDAERHEGERKERDFKFERKIEREKDKWNTRKIERERYRKRERERERKRERKQSLRGERGIKLNLLTENFNLKFQRTGTVKSVCLIFLSTVLIKIKAKNLKF